MISNSYQSLIDRLDEINQKKMEQLNLLYDEEKQRQQEMLRRASTIKTEECDSLSPAPPSPTPPVYVLEPKPEISAMINCSFKDGKANRRERRAKERMMKKLNKRK